MRFVQIWIVNTNKSWPIKQFVLNSKLRINLKRKQIRYPSLFCGLNWYSFASSLVWCENGHNFKKREKSLSSPSMSFFHIKSIYIPFRLMWKQQNNELLGHNNSHTGKCGKLRHKLNYAQKTNNINKALKEAYHWD